MSLGSPIAMKRVGPDTPSEIVKVVCIILKLKKCEVNPQGNCHRKILDGMCSYFEIFQWTVIGLE